MILAKTYSGYSSIRLSDLIFEYFWKFYMNTKSTEGKHILEMPEFCFVKHFNDSQEQFAWI